MQLGSTAASLMSYFIVGTGLRIATWVVGVFCVSQSVDAIQDFMPAFNLNNMFAGVPDAFLFGLWFVDAPYNFALILPAYALAFALRRKAVFGG